MLVWRFMFLETRTLVLLHHDLDFTTHYLPYSVCWLFSRCCPWNWAQRCWVEQCLEAPDIHSVTSAAPPPVIAHVSGPSLYFLQINNILDELVNSVTNVYSGELNKENVNKLTELRNVVLFFSHAFVDFIQLGLQRCQLIIELVQLTLILVQLLSLLSQSLLLLNENILLHIIY